MGIERNSITDKAYNRLKEAGLSEAGIFGLFGNIYAESGFRPNNLENLCERRLREAGKEYCTDESYTAAIDSGKISCEDFLHPLPGKQYGYGLCQWTSPGRKSGLYTLVKRKGVSIADPDAQIEWLLSELSNSYPSVLKVLKSAKTIREASNIVLTKFECPADQGESVKDVRAVYGEKYRELYAGKKEEVSSGMTEMQARLVYVNIMNGWIGLKRSDGSHMVIIDTYNGHKPLARGYAVKRDDAYCATTISAASIIAGYTDIIPTECGCGQMIALYQKMGRWVENDAYVPEVGDIVFYYWNDGANYAATDCTGWPDHVGVVVKVDKSARVLRITEGNMSGGVVGQRDLQINGRYIRGYGVPDYAKKATASVPPTPSKPSTGDDGNTSSGEISKTPKWTGQVTADSLNVRTWAGKENPNIKSYPLLGKGNLVDVCDTIKAANGDPWYYVRIAGKFYGFVSAKYIQKADSSSGTTGGNNAGSGNQAPSYKVGVLYTLQVELKVRKGAGTGCATKSYSQLTADGQRHDLDKDGCLDAGTQVTCQAVQEVGNDIWIKAPSGWLAAYYQGQQYIK